MLVGLVGQISLAQAAFAGSAGFALSKIGTGLPFPFSLLAAALVATALGSAGRVPALRIRGVQLAVVTLAAGVAIEQLVFHNPKLSPPGGNLIPDPSLFGIDLGVRDGHDIARWQFGAARARRARRRVRWRAILARAAPGGRCWRCARTSGRRRRSASTSPRAKLLAFALSSFLAGLGGALIGYSRGQLSPESFGVARGLALLAFAYLGGITASAARWSPARSRRSASATSCSTARFDLGAHYLLVSGLLLVATAVLNPGASPADRAMVAASAGAPAPTPTLSPTATADAPLGA